MFSKGPCMVKLPGCTLASSLLDGKASSHGKGALLNSALAVAVTQQRLLLSPEIYYLNLVHQNIGSIFRERRGLEFVAS